jgi:hypothetical protein
MLEVEGFLRMFLGDQASKADLRASLEATARQARAMRVKGKALIDDLLNTGGPFPHRLHLVERQATFIADFYRDLIEWCEQTIADIDRWPDTRDIGLTPGGRKQWERILAEPDP